MGAYKLSKNGWVMPFFVIFRLVREKLLVTVALDHPVPLIMLVEGLPEYFEFNPIFQNPAAIKLLE